MTLKQYSEVNNLNGYMVIALRHASAHAYRWRDTVHAVSISVIAGGYNTQVNRMSRSRRVLAIGGKQRFFGLDMVFIETILFHLESFWGIRQHIGR